MSRTASRAGDLQALHHDAWQQGNHQSQGGSVSLRCWAFTRPGQMLLGHAPVQRARGYRGGDDFVQLPSRLGMSMPYRGSRRSKMLGNELGKGLAASAPI